MCGEKMDCIKNTKNKHLIEKVFLELKHNNYLFYCEVGKNCFRGKMTKRPASNSIYFSQEYKYFDQHLPTVKNETTV